MHGGDIYRNKVELDFSVNVNPFGMPEGVKAALFEAAKESIFYPDIRYEGLKNAISEMLGVRKSSILCGNGSSELFPAIARAVYFCRNNGNKPFKAIIPVPSFSGYERAARACNADIIFYEMKKEDRFCLTDDFFNSLDKDTDILFLANPNNPTGCVVGNTLLEKILEICNEKGIFVVLDECFIEFVKGYEAHSFIKRLDEFHNLIIVRSFTKIFAIPGVRLGYLVCNNADLIEKIDLQLPEWNISVFAQKAGIAATKDKNFIKNTVKAVEKEKDYLIQGLVNLGITVYPGQADFLLIHTECPLTEKLLKRGILIRDCSDFRGLAHGYYRVCVKKREENSRLIRAVEEIVCR